MTKDEFIVLWRYVAAVHGRAGHVVDPQCKDASHLWFFGARRNDDYATGMQDGELLDVDAILVAANIEDDISIEDSMFVGPTSSTPPVNVKDRASKYLAKMPEAISGSGGHVATFKAALVLVRGFGLGTDDALDLLQNEYNPRCQPSWSEKELRHKVEDAAKLHDPPPRLPLAAKRVGDGGVRRGARRERDADRRSGSRHPRRTSFTDDGNALRLVDAAGERIRYVVEWRSFLRWNGKVWERDPEGHLVREEMRKLTRIWAEAASKIENDDCRKRALAWAIKSQSAGRLDAAVDLVKGDARVRIQVGDLDARPFLLNVQNGVVDLRDIDLVTKTCRLLPHDPKLLLTRITKVSYVPEAVAPTWDAFCRFSANSDPDVEAYRRRRRGSYLSGSPDKVLEVAFGKGDTGKTSYYQTLARVMGSYAQKVPRTIFEKQRNEQHPADLVELEGVRFAFGAEIEGTMDIQKVKDVTGERIIKARGMRENWRSVERKYKVAVFANDAPKINRTTADPIWNRIHADKWSAVITDKKSEAEIDEVYEREGEGILVDMIRGWIDYQSRGLAPPKAIVEVTGKYRTEEDPLQGWLDECADTSDASVTTLFKSIWESRTSWLAEHDPDRGETPKAFAKLLEQRGFAATKDKRTGAALRVGIRIRGRDEALSDEPVLAPEDHPLKDF